MSENINVSPSPVQRNAIDAAIDLTELYLKYYTVSENLEEIYARFYAITSTLARKHPDFLKELIPEELLKKIK